MIGLYILARFMAVVIGMMLLIFFIVCYMAWLLLKTIGHALLEPRTYHQPPRVPPGRPRSERLFYSDRR